MVIKGCYGIFITAAVVIGLVSFGNKAVYAYPGACVLIPTCDTMAAKSIRLSYEAEGHTNPYDRGYTEYLYTQIGIGGRLEVGADVYDIKSIYSPAPVYYNAKYLLLKETAKYPALAAGTMLIGNNVSASYYIVGCKSFKQTRLHLGAQTKNNDTWALIGSDYALGHGLSLLADWQTGDGRYQAYSIYWQTTPSIGLTLYYATNNTSELKSSTDYVAFNIGYTFTYK